MSVLGSFLSSWEEMPSGIVGAVFPALAGILLREEDIDILIVQIPPLCLSFCNFNPFLAIVCCRAYVQNGQRLLSSLISQGYPEISQWYFPSI